MPEDARRVRENRERDCSAYDSLAETRFGDARVKGRVEGQGRNAVVARGEVGCGERLSGGVSECNGRGGCCSDGPGIEAREGEEEWKVGREVRRGSSAQAGGRGWASRGGGRTRTDPAWAHWPMSEAGLVCRGVRQSSRSRAGRDKGATAQKQGGIRMSGGEGASLAGGEAQSQSQSQIMRRRPRTRSPEMGRCGAVWTCRSVGGDVVVGNAFQPCRRDGGRDACSCSQQPSTHAPCRICFIQRLPSLVARHTSGSGRGSGRLAGGLAQALRSDGLRLSRWNGVRDAMAIRDWRDGLKA